MKKRDIRKSSASAAVARHLIATLRTEPESDGKVIAGMVGGARYVIVKGRGATWHLYIETRA